MVFLNGRYGDCGSGVVNSSVFAWSKGQTIVNSSVFVVWNGRSVVHSSVFVCFCWCVALTCIKSQVFAVDIGLSDVQKHV